MTSQFLRDFEGADFNALASLLQTSDSDEHGLSQQKSNPNGLLPITVRLDVEPMAHGLGPSFRPVVIPSWPGRGWVDPDPRKESWYVGDRVSTLERCSDQFRIPHSSSGYQPKRSKLVVRPPHPPPPPSNRTVAKGAHNRAVTGWRPRGGTNRGWWSVYNTAISHGSIKSDARAAAQRAFPSG